jgi:GNAT superfamily N-acetyltransferase
MSVIGELTFREGRTADLREAFGLFERAIHHTAARMGAAPSSGAVDEEDIEGNWNLERPLIEFIAAQDGGRFWVCHSEQGLVGFARVVRFGRMEQLTEVAVAPQHHGAGIGRALVERCWPGAPTQDLGRLVVAAGSVVDLSFYMAFGAMPATGHWHLEVPTERYLERRSQELDRDEPGVHVLEVGRAVEEWKRLEPKAIGHERPLLHEFFGRERTCLAHLDGDGAASALCWVSPAAEIGPGVGRQPQDLVPVVLAALDRVAKLHEPEDLHVFCVTDSWWLLRRLKALGFRVSWPSWVACSEPLPGLDRYLPTRPAFIL